MVVVDLGPIKSIEQFCVPIHSGHSKNYFVPSEFEEKIFSVDSKETVVKLMTNIVDKFDIKKLLVCFPFYRIHTLNIPAPSKLRPTV